MKLFDAHCHLQFPQYEEDRDAVLERMREKEVGAIVVGTDYKTSREGVLLAERHDFLWAAVGLHPNDNLEEEFDAEAFKELAKHSKVVAIGECGLDYYRSGGTLEEKSAQKERFEKQVDLAQRLNKPLIIHCRDPLRLVEGEASAHEDMLEILRASRKGGGEKLKVVIHFFTGSGELAQQYLSLGCYLSFPGPVTYTDMYDESIRVTPLDKMLVETDAPFAAPVPYRGKRNEPFYVEHVAAKIAAIKSLSPEDTAFQTVQNAHEIFDI